MAKDPYGLIRKETETFDGMTDAELNDRISQVAKNDAALLEAKEQDPDLAQAKEEVKVASYDYNEGHKANKQRIAYIRDLLRARGKDAGTAATSRRG